MILGHERCSLRSHEHRLLGACGHRGHMVGRSFIVEDGKRVFKPRDMVLRTLAGLAGLPRGPIWDVEEPIYNAQDEWTCREQCYGPTDFGHFFTTFAFPEFCVGLGTDTVGHPGGLCAA